MPNSSGCGRERRPHLLQPNTRSRRPENHIFFDVETDLSDFEGEWRTHTFKMGWALFWRRREPQDRDQLEWYRIEDFDDFWVWVESKVRGRTRVILSSHNLSYDLFVTKGFFLLPQRGWALTRFYCEAQSKVFTFRKGTKSIVCLDNCNWFKGSLEKWGETIGLKKGIMPIPEAGVGAWDRYCKRDVEIVYRLWVWWYRFCDDHGLGSWSITLPSQAFTSFRHRFMTHKIFIHTNPDAISLERAAYHGGRSECFKLGHYDEGPYYKLDINSMYPWAMQAFDYPSSFRGVAKAMTLKRLRFHLNRGLVISRVGIYSDEPFFPAVKEGRICYPVGRFETVLTTPELVLAMDRGWVEEVKETAYYNKAPIFQDYVKYFYPLKDRYFKEGNQVCFELCKLLLNSLYGKFGQLSSTMKVIGKCDPGEFKVEKIFDAERMRWTSEYYIGGQIFWSYKGGEGYHSFPAIAAHVTAYSRIYLYNLILAAGRGNVFYCDTDSLIVNQTGYDRFKPFIRPGELGNFKLEAQGNVLEIRAPKDYTLGETTRIKGIKKNAVWLNDHTVEQEIFPSIKGLLGKGIETEYHTYKMVKVLRREIKSGVVCEDGTIIPWELGALL